MNVVYGHLILPRKNPVRLGTDFSASIYKDNIYMRRTSNLDMMRAGEREPDILNQINEEDKSEKGSAVGSGVNSAIEEALLHIKNNEHLYAIEEKGEEFE